MGAFFWSKKIMAKEQKKVSFEVLRGIRINGVSIFPSTDEKKKVIISLPETFARELAYASKGKIVESKANTKVAEPPSDEDGLDVFGQSDDESGTDKTDKK
jgi:hypothetical protein